MNIVNLIHPCRFDLMAKYLYIKFKNIDFYRELYKNHIITFNKCWEYPGTKVNIDDFIRSFNTLLDSLVLHGFDRNYPITVGKNNVLVNGSHRLMICFYYGIEPSIQLENTNGCMTYHYDFFLNRNKYWRRNDEIYQNLPRIYSDCMALEYCKINTNIRSNTLQL